MAFVKKETIEIGDQVRLLERVEGTYGYFEEGSVVTIFDICERGMAIEDDEGNRVREIGYSKMERLTKSDAEREKAVQGFKAIRRYCIGQTGNSDCPRDCPFSEKFCSQCENPTKEWKIAPIDWPELD